MKVSSIFCLPIVALAALAGCKPQLQANPASPPTATATTGDDSVKTGQPGEPPVGPAPQTTSLNPADIPAALKTDAYRFAGVENTKPMDLEVVRPNQPMLTGAATNSIKEIK